ncbi:hypothetical protein [Methylocapsa aurea]|uniref:hypothetical protein n=1 Tax=Methylocapsa aurea TaxID=663610 RepID=UPI000568172A|nr:hypothetical protein [Methylocapsa aurea]
MDKEKQQLPPGFRPLDLEIFEKWALLEARCVALNERCDAVPAIVKVLKEIIDAQREELESMRRRMMKYDDAYYHIFPERLAHDVRLLDQLDALTSKPVSDADSKKG